MGETKLQREPRQKEPETRRAVGRSLREIRIDAGLTIAAVARAVGIHGSYLSRIERGERAGTLRVLIAIATVLGADLSVKVYPNTGPRIRDRHQAPMADTLIRSVHRRWVPDPEVPVHQPARGVVDVVFTDRRRPTLVATEIQSVILRLEQLIRWHRLKEESLPSADMWALVAADSAPMTSRLLVLRSTREMRDLVNRFEATLRAAYPARVADVIRALTTVDAPWPGAGSEWMRGRAGRAELLPGPPRGVRLGR